MPAPASRDAFSPLVVIQREVRDFDDQKGLRPNRTIGPFIGIGAYQYIRLRLRIELLRNQRRLVVNPRLSAECILKQVVDGLRGFNTTVSIRPEGEFVVETRNRHEMAFSLGTCPQGEEATELIE